MKRTTVSRSALLSRLGRLCALAVAGLFAATATANPYLTFSSAQSFTITPRSKTWNGTLYYSTDATSWSVFGTAGADAADDGSGTYKLHLRGAGNTRISNAANTPGWTLTAATNVACSGNIETLLDYTAVAGGRHPAMTTYCFSNLFKGWKALTEAPTLPATALPDRCYSFMFEGCLSLAAPPALPATALADYCYYGMFNNCKSLAQAPALPATTLAPNCYGYMFEGCASLAQAPALPATTLADSCYKSMFSSCKSLTAPPALPATTLADNCYYSMFHACSGLAQAPALPATTLTRSCYTYMFRSCSGLTQAPELPATTLADYCYFGVFQGCSGIKLHNHGPAGAEWSIPAGATPATAQYWNNNMFSDTGGTFTGNPVIGTVYYQETADFPAYNQHYLTFSSAQSFTIKPPSKTWAGRLYYSTDATNWTFFSTPGADAADDGAGTYKLHLRGAGNTRISAASANAAAWMLTAGGTVACSGNAETLLDYTAVVGGQHPAMTDYCFANLFKGWTALTNAPALPATTLAGYCYYGMFSGCTGLTQVPTLPATALADYCYYGMFSGCTGIRLNVQGPGMEWSIPAAAVPASNWNNNMLVGTGGTFTGDPVIGVIYYYTPGGGPDPDPEAPVITAITVADGGATLDITIDNAITGAWYTLLVADELGQSWAVSPAIQATADGILIFQNVPATLPHRFYKVRASATQP